MIFVLLAWLLPFITVVVIMYTLVDENTTVRDFLKLAGMSLIPVSNWFVVGFVIVEVITSNDKIQEFLNKKLK